MRFFRQFQHLLPFSEAWRTTIEKQLRQFFQGLAAGTQEPAVEFVDDAYLQLFPDTTDQLNEWETQFFGLPRDGLLEPARRQLLDARWKAQGGQSPRYIQDVLQAAGFDLYVHEWFESAPSYSGNSISVVTQNATATGAAFNSNGTKMFVSDLNLGNVNEYDLSTAWDITSATFSQNFSTSTQDAQPMDVTFNPDGTIMYVPGNATDTIYQYTLTTGFDLSTASYSGNSLSLVATDNILRGIHLSPDGTKVFFVGQQNNKVYQFDLGTPFDISTGADSGNTLDLSAQATGMTGIVLNAAGTTMLVISASSDLVYSYGLSTAFDLSSAVFSGAVLDVSAQDNIPQDVVLGNGENSIFVVGTQNDSVYEYSFADCITYTDSTKSFFLGTSGGTGQGGIYMRPDGLRFFTVASTQDEVQAWDLPTAFDVSTATPGAQFDISSQSLESQGVDFSPDGTLFFVVDVSTQTVYQYEMTTAWDVSTASYTGNSFDVSNEETVPLDLRFNFDGSKMFVCGPAGGGDVYEYDLSTRFDVSTAAYNSVSFDTSTQDIAPSGMSFADSGFTLWIAGDGNNKLYKYLMNVQFDIANAVFDSEIDVSGFSSNPVAITFGECADKNLYFIDRSLSNVYQYWRCQPLDPRVYTSQPLLGNTQCGDDGSAFGTPIAECGEQPPDQKSVLSAKCNAFLVNDVGYLVNENLTPKAPPPVPDDPAKWPYFLYIGGETFPSVATVSDTLQNEFEDLILRIAPAQQWIVTLINFAPSAGGSGFAYTFAFDVPA